MKQDLQKLSIKERDNIISKLNKKIGELKGFQKYKRKEIKEKEKDNKLLKRITKKYNKQLQLSHKIKEKQIIQILELLEYLEKSTKSTELSTIKLEEVNNQRDILIKELNHMNKELTQMNKEMKGL